MRASSRHKQWFTVSSRKGWNTFICAQRPVGTQTCNNAVNNCNGSEGCSLCNRAGGHKRLPSGADKNRTKTSSQRHDLFSRWPYSKPVAGWIVRSNPLQTNKKRTRFYEKAVSNVVSGAGCRLGIRPEQYGRALAEDRRSDHCARNRQSGGSNDRRQRQYDEFDSQRRLALGD